MADWRNTRTLDCESHECWTVSHECWTMSQECWTVSQECWTLCQECSSVPGVFPHKCAGTSGTSGGLAKLGVKRGYAPASCTTEQAA